MTEFNRALALRCTAALLAAVDTAAAEDRPAAVELTIKGHSFLPSEIHVPAGKATFLEILNQDVEAEEFEMRQLAIEKLIPGGGKGRVRLRPLGPGRYEFVGEFHEDTAQGAVIAE